MANSMHVSCGHSGGQSLDKTLDGEEAENWDQLLEALGWQRSAGIRFVQGPRLSEAQCQQPAKQMC